jgi:lysozyme family protein
MKQNFEIVFPLLMQSEGTTYTNTPGDNGGPTKYGITLQDVKDFVKKDATAQDVKNLTLVQAKVIYQAKYWNSLNCDSLDSGVDYTCFDYGVNSGLARPRNALKKFPKLKGVALIDAINNERATFLRGLAATQEHDQQFLRGWLARVERVRMKSKELASKNTVAGPATGAIVAGGAAALTVHQSFWQGHEMLIIVGGILAAIVAGVVAHLYINKGK